MIYCARCDAANGEGNHFCGACGAVLGAVDTQTNEQPVFTGRQKRKMARGASVFALGCLILLIGLMLVLVLVVVLALAH